MGYEGDECTSRKERRCEKHWEEPIKGKKVWVDNPATCKYFDATDCRPVTKYRTEQERYTTCDQVPYEHCDRVKDTNCYQVPKQECKNVKIPGEMNAALNTEKNATTIPDPSKYRMRKMNVLVERSGVARSIGKSLSRERRFGLITQQPANILMPRTADQ